jgi:hypothetical protein
MIAHGQIGSAGPDLDDRPGTLVAEHDGHRVVQRPVRDRQVRVAHSGRRDLNHHLTGPGWLYVQVDQLDRLIRFFQQCRHGAHRRCLPIGDSSC